MLIRKATVSEIPELLRLLVQVCNVHAAIRPDIFRPGGVKYTEIELRKLLGDETCPIWVAVEDGKILGYCFCKWNFFQDSTASKDRTELYIDDLCVDAASRGRGVGTALCRHVIRTARAAEADCITLNVWCGNEDAMHFYEKMGLRPRNIVMELPLED